MINKIKNPKGIIFSVAFAVMGVGAMSISSYKSSLNTVGGGLFIVGTIMLSYFLIQELKKTDNGNNK